MWESFSNILLSNSVDNESTADSHFTSDIISTFDEVSSRDIVSAALPDKISSVDFLFLRLSVLDNI